MSVLRVLQDLNDTTKQKNFIRNKAVSDGAISFYLDHFVRTRVSKFTYGVICNILYDRNDPEHKSRSDKVFTAASGDKRINGFFDIILPKVAYNPFPRKYVILKIFIFRIPKFRRRRNSENLIASNQILPLFFPELMIFLFGATEETSRLQSGKTLIPVRHLIIICLVSLVN